jgi:hypothetical protein
MSVKIDYNFKLFDRKWFPGVLAQHLLIPSPIPGNKGAE